MTISNQVIINDLIAQLAKELKSIPEIKAPSWSAFVKTGAHKEKPPVNDDWWYTRSAAVLLKVQKLGPVGVSKLRTEYGGRKNRGVRPDRFVKGSGNILRKVLQQLDAAKLTEKIEKEQKKGRKISSKGTSFIYAAAKKVGITSSKLVVKKEVKPVQKAVEKETPKSEEKSKSEKKDVAVKEDK